MISGIAKMMLAPLLMALSAASPPAPDPDASALIARLARPAPAITAYVEVRFVDLLTRPLQLRGELEYRGDASLVKRVAAPYRETTTIAAGQVTIERNGKPTRHFALTRAPELAAFLESFAALLGGDSARLAQTYDSSVTHEAAHWRLTLTPRAERLRKHLAQIVVDGSDDAPRCFTVQESGGDASVLLVEAAAKATLPEAPTREGLAALCRGTP
jgi:hypothetical protein